ERRTGFGMRRIGRSRLVASLIQLVGVHRLADRTDRHEILGLETEDLSYVLPIVNRSVHFRDLGLYVVDRSVGASGHGLDRVAARLLVEPLEVVDLPFDHSLAPGGPETFPHLRVEPVDDEADGVVDDVGNLLGPRPAPRFLPDHQPDYQTEEGEQDRAHQDRAGAAHSIPSRDARTAR